MKKSFFILLFSLVTCLLFSQRVWDTTRYVKYSDRLVLSGFLGWRFFDYKLKQKVSEDTAGISSIHYKPNTSTAIGFEMDFDKISLAVAFRAKLDDSARASKGNSDFRNLAVSVGGNKWILETGYRSTTGFYDEHTIAYDTTIKQTGIYYQNPSLEVKQIKAKFLFFKNYTRFAFKAGYGYTSRQLKTAFSWAFGGNIYNNKLTADSSLVPRPIRHFYGENAYLNNLSVSGVSGGAGGSLNIVLWKKFFLNATFILFMEPQWRTYGRLNTEASKLCYVSISNDARLSIAYNADHFFMSLYGTWDRIYVNSAALDVESQQISGAFSIGYRFKVKTPKFYKKIQETKVYKML